MLVMMNEKEGRLSGIEGQLMGLAWCGWGQTASLKVEGIDT